ncbi:MAG: inositol monophosphatase [Myxococcales bacterium]|nr:inositol monophosphatase [Myxococcales bacterium]
MKDVCIAAAQAGAKVLRDLYHRPRDIQLKGRIDLVTDADKASEETVLRKLHELAPGVKILAEESGEHGKGDARFIVDPLDGTTNYAHGIPLFCCTVAFEENGRVVAGCTVDPLRDEVFRAARGEGAWLGSRKLQVSPARELESAVVCTGFPYGNRERLPHMAAVFARFTEIARGTRRLGSAALDLAYTAAGRLDGFWEMGLAPWDVAAGQLLVEEAGGLVTRFDGSPLTLDGREIAAAGPNLHAAILEVIRVTSAATLPSAR